MLAGLLRKLSGRQDSKETAKKRLKFALIYDKLEVSENILQDLQGDIRSISGRGGDDIEVQDRLGDSHGDRFRRGG